MEMDMMIEGKISQNQIKNAIDALFAYLTNQKNPEKKQLWEEDDYISLQISLKKIPDQSNNSPKIIPLRHSLFGREGKAICLITKDPQEEFEEKMKEQPVSNIIKVLSISKLRSDYKRYEDKRTLASSFDLFIADKRIIPLLPPLIGKSFFSKKKQPVPVSLTKTKFASKLVNIRDSTFLFLPSGTCCMVRIGEASFTISQIIDNIFYALPHIINNIPKKWKNIQSISIKSSNSIALPIYNSLNTL